MRHSRVHLIFGKVGLEVSGHTVDKEAFLAHCYFIVAVQMGRILTFLLSPPPSPVFIILFNTGSSISVPDSFVSRVHCDQLSSRLAFSTSNQ